MGAVIGALVGGGLFILFGAVPVFHFSGFVAVTILSRISRRPLNPSAFVRCMIIATTVMGVVTGAVLSAACGGLVGWGIEYALRGFS